MVAEGGLQKATQHADGGKARAMKYILVVSPLLIVVLHRAKYRVVWSSTSVSNHVAPIGTMTKFMAILPLQSYHDLYTITRGYLLLIGRFKSFRNLCCNVPLHFKSLVSADAGLL